MQNFSYLNGVYAAAVTPLNADFSPALEAIPLLCEFLSGRGCHGALLLGTTGEGPSFSPAERQDIFVSAAGYKHSHPDFSILVGTGTPSLQETIDLNQAAFEAGMDGVVVLPPYYFRTVNDDGLFAWYSQVIERSVPSGKAFYAYHFPKVSGVSLSLDLLERLLTAFPDRFAGIKDSSGDTEHTRLLGERFGAALQVFNGNDRLLTLALHNHAVGCITAMGNIYSPYLRQVWDAFQDGGVAGAAQEALDSRRAVVDRYPPAPALLKAMLSDQHNMPLWPVRPALMALDDSARAQARTEFQILDG